MTDDYQYTIDPTPWRTGSGMGGPLTFYAMQPISHDKTFLELEVSSLRVENETLKEQIKMLYKMIYGQPVGSIAKP